MKKSYPVPPWQPRVRVRFSTGEVYELGSKRHAAHWAGRSVLLRLIDEKKRPGDAGIPYAGWRRKMATVVCADGTRIVYFDNGEYMAVPPHRPAYQFFTELGDEVSAEELWQVLRDEYRWYPRSYPNKPLPGSRWRCGSFGLRRPHTFPEHRWVSGYVADVRQASRYAFGPPADEVGEDVGWRYGVRAKIRLGRNEQNLVDAWDDIPRASRRCHSSWKRQRRRQWKG